jgi:hypothetical protein
MNDPTMIHYTLKEPPRWEQIAMAWERGQREREPFTKIDAQIVTIRTNHNRRLEINDRT